MMNPATPPRSPSRPSSASPPSPAVPVPQHLDLDNCLEVLVRASKLGNTVLESSTLRYIDDALDPSNAADFLLRASSVEDPVAVSAVNAATAFLSDNLPACSGPLLERIRDLPLHLLLRVVSAAPRGEDRETETAKFRVAEAFSSLRHVGSDLVDQAWSVVDFEMLDPAFLNSRTLSRAARKAMEAREHRRQQRGHSGGRGHSAEGRSGHSGSRHRHHRRHEPPSVVELREELRAAAAAARTTENRMLSELESLRRRLEAVEIRLGPSLSAIAGSGVCGDADGTGLEAAFSNPMGLCISTSSPWDTSVFVADCSNHRIRRVTTAGVVTTVAGSRLGYADGAADVCQFYSPSDVAADALGNLYVADQNNSRVRKISPGGTVTTVAGNGVAGFSQGKCPGTSASFDHPSGVAVDLDTGNVFVADLRNQRIRKIVCKNGHVKTVAGSGATGFADGSSSVAAFNGPTKLVVDRSSGSLVVADTNNNRLRRILHDGSVITIAGNGAAACTDGCGAGACFNGPVDVDVDQEGNLFVVEYGSHCVRKITRQGSVVTVFGKDGPNAHSSQASSSLSRLSFPYGIAVDPVGALVIADYGNHRICRLTAV